MFKRVALAAILAVACGVCSPVLAPAQPAPSPPAATFSLIVKLVSGLSADEQALVIARNGGIETLSIPALHLHVVEGAASDLPAILANYQSDPQVLSVEQEK